MNLNRVKKVLVTNVTGANTGTTLATIIDGDMLVLGKTMANLTGTPVPSDANADSIFIALGDASRDNGFILSSEIKSGQVSKWSKQAFQAAVEQFAYLGYNGTANTLALGDNLEHRLRLSVPDRHNLLPHQKRDFDHYFTTPSTADQYEAANSFAKSINADTRGVRIKFRAEAVSDGTLTEFGATADPNLIKGSDQVLFDAVHGRSVGDIVAFTIAAAGLLAVFKVKSIEDTTNLTLDRKWEAPTRAIDVSATTDEAVIVTATTLWGIYITAVAVTQRTYAGGLPLDVFQQMQFTVGLGPINGLVGEEETVTNTAAVPPLGSGPMVRDLEVDAQGWSGFTNRVLFPVDDPQLNGVVANQYDVYIIEHYDEINTGQGISRDPITTILCFKSDVTTKLDAVDAILNSWMAATPNGLAGV